MTQPRHTRCLIVGSGPAGYTAAVYAARALLKPVLIQGIQPGGQLTITTDVENYPGFADVIQGPWLMEQMQAQAAHVGTELVNDIVLSADLSKRPFHIKCDSGAEWLAETLIICTGATSSGRRRSCRSGCSPIRRSRWSGTTPSTRCWAATPASPACA